METAQITLEKKVIQCASCERFKNESGNYVRVPIELEDYYMNNCDVLFKYCSDCKKEFMKK